MILIMLNRKIYVVIFPKTECSLTDVNRPLILILGMHKFRSEDLDEGVDFHENI